MNLKALGSKLLTASPLFRQLRIPEFVILLFVRRKVTMPVHGAKDQITSRYGNAFETLKRFHERKQDWLFGFLGYDLKNSHDFRYLVA